MSINIWRQVVGTSCDASTPRICKAYVWKNDVMRDLNTLVPPGLGARLTSANDIDDLGRITGTALLPNGDTKAFVATPAW